MNDCLLNEARQLYEANQLSKALNVYQQVLDNDPSQLEALRFSGILYAKLGEKQKAIASLKKAVSLCDSDAGLHYNLANAYKQVFEFDAAIKHYHYAIALQPNHAGAHTNLGAIATRRDDYKQALRHYYLALQAEPDYIPAHYQLGLLFIKQNQLNEAATAFNNVLSLYPNHLEALFYSAVIHLGNHLLEQAETQFLQVLAINDEHLQTLCNLGIIALKRDQRQLAVDYFTKALTLDEHHIESRNNLAATFMHFDRFENALMHYDVLLKQDPANTEYLYNMGVAEMSLGHLDKAKQHFESILKQDPTHSQALSNLGVIYIRSEQHERAIDYLRQATAANPEDSVSEFMLQALVNQSAKVNPCFEYVQNLFNNYALYYDKHMNETLHYSLPQHTAKILHQLNYLSVNKTLDLGCGTGLTGVVLREISQYLVGVDIAPKMIEQAREKCIYDTLVTDEVLHYLQQAKASYELIVANDVLPYLGDLHELFKQIKQILSSPGLFVFTIEIGNNNDWMLQKSARFCHSPHYIERMCLNNGFDIVAKNEIIARQQYEEDLVVLMYVVSNIEN